METRPGNSRVAPEDGTTGMTEKQCQGGDAWAAIYREHGRMLYRKARHIFGRFPESRIDDNVIEDMVQDTISSAFEGIEGFRGESKVGSWLSTILRNKCVDYLRRMERQPRPLSDEVCAARQDDPLFASIASEARLMNDRERQQVMACVEKLLARLRSGSGISKALCLMKSILEGRASRPGWEEMAVEWGCKPKDARQYWYEAKKRLKAMLRDGEQDDCR